MIYLLIVIIGLLAYGLWRQWRDHKWKVLIVTQLKVITDNVVKPTPEGKRRVTQNRPVKYKKKENGSEMIFGGFRNTGRTSPSAPSNLRVNGDARSLGADATPIAVPPSEHGEWAPTKEDTK